MVVAYAHVAFSSVVTDNVAVLVPTESAVNAVTIGGVVSLAAATVVKYETPSELT